MNKIISLIVVFSVCLSSCGRFDEYNTNPDSTTEVTAAMLATGVELSSFRSSGDGKAYISYSALPKYVAYLTEGAMDAQYNKIGRCSYDSYLLWPDYEYINKYAGGTDYEASYKGLTLFLKAFNAYRLTMQLGDIPYSGAGMGKQGMLKPEYDTQEYVFSQILDDLRKAEAAFAAGKAFAGDIIYGGDTSKWRKAVNALRLKVLMSLSRKITDSQKQEFRDIVSSGILMSGNEDNLQLEYTEKSGTWHPLYNQKLFNPYTTVSKLVVDELKRLEDRRLFYFAEPAQALLAEGKKESEFDAYEGTDTSADFNISSASFESGKFSVINKRYLERQAGDPYIHLTFAEQCFIIAEAAESGWVSEDSGKYYEEGVTAALVMVASFDTDNKYNHNMPIDEEYLASYLKGNAGYASSKEERMKQIWMQRYLLKFLQDGYDAYFEVRRTGYPELPNDPSTSLNVDNKNMAPARWQYPESESKTNSDNLNAALSRQFNNSYDGINELMWILK